MGVPGLAEIVMYARQDDKYTSVVEEHCASNERDGISLVNAIRASLATSGLVYPGTPLTYVL